MATSQISIIAVLKKDCEKLIDIYVKQNTTSFSEFITAWKSMEFDLIYAGQGECEIDYFIFQVIHIAKGFINPSKSKLTRVAGLYLLYMLYYTEPLKIKKSIRLVPEDFTNLKTLAQEYKSINKEVSFAFYKLLLDNAFDFVVTSLPYDENLLHFKEEMKTRGSTEVDSHKSAVDSLFKQSGFDMDKWAGMVKDYNSVKKKINSTCTINLALTKGLESV